MTRPSASARKRKSKTRSGVTWAEAIRLATQFTPDDDRAIELACDCPGGFREKGTTCEGSGKKRWLRCQGAVDKWSEILVAKKRAEERAGKKKS